MTSALISGILIKICKVFSGPWHWCLMHKCKYWCKGKSRVSG